MVDAPPETPPGARAERVRVLALRATARHRRSRGRPEEGGRRSVRHAGRVDRGRVGGGRRALRRLRRLLPSHARHYRRAREAPRLRGCAGDYPPGSRAGRVGTGGRARSRRRGRAGRRRQTSASGLRAHLRFVYTEYSTQYVHESKPPMSVPHALLALLSEGPSTACGCRPSSRPGPARSGRSTSGRSTRPSSGSSGTSLSRPTTAKASDRGSDTGSRARVNASSPTGFAPHPSSCLPRVTSS